MQASLRSISYKFCVVSGSGRFRWVPAMAIAVSFLPLCSRALFAQPAIGERPAVEVHMRQERIDRGDVSLQDLIGHGALLFRAAFNALDGQGRPGSTGAGAPRVPDEPAFIRTSAPESTSCVTCHAKPIAGGAGDFTTNAFVMAEGLDPVTTSVDAETADERNPPSLFGTGAIELLAREMTADLHAIRDEALREASALGPSAEVTRALVTKGVSFGKITVRGDGRVDPTGIEGIDWDLVVKPFHQKGAVVSLRQFTNNATNHHLGMQSMERFGPGEDPDLDGHADELTVGDLTAMAVFQATLGVPGRRIRDHPAVREAVARGERLFADIGCASCHVTELRLRDGFFYEPNPWNPPGNLRPEDVPRPVAVDLTAEGPGPHLERAAGGGAVVAAFTDLKRHDLNDRDFDHFANERLAQGSLYGSASPSSFYDEPPETDRPTREFLTRRLWDAGSTAPYGHRGDLTTLSQAIHFHGGEARGARDAFMSLADGDRAAVLEFLLCLQILPPGSPRVVYDPVDEDGRSPRPGRVRDPVDDLRDARRPGSPIP